MNDGGAGAPAEGPSFAKDFPKDPALREALDAFNRGDYAAVRRLTPKIEASSEDPAVKAAARTLAQRTRADPLAIVLFGLTLALLITLTGWWIHFSGPGPRPPPRPAPVEHVK